MRLSLEEVVAGVEDLTQRAAALGPASGAEGRVVAVFREALDEFRNLLPVVEQLAHPALRDRHWTAIFVLLGLDRVSLCVCV